MADKRLIKTFVEQLRRNPQAPAVLSEGDSWFSYPFHRNTIDHLESARMCLLRLERNGDELLQILSGKQKHKLRKTLARYPIDALLFSGGGNDLLGPDLASLLKSKSGNLRGAELIRKGRLNRRMRQLRDAFLDLIAMRDDHCPACHIFVHGYDYPSASGKPTRKFGLVLSGPWILPAFQQHQILDPQDQTDVLESLIDRFNRTLASLAITARGFVHIDVRNTLTARQWKDEVHPTSGGFATVANHFRIALKREFPGL